MTAIKSKLYLFCCSCHLSLLFVFVFLLTISTSAFPLPVLWCVINQCINPIVTRNEMQLIKPLTIIAISQRMPYNIFNSWGLRRFWPRSLVSCVYPECVWNNTSSCRDMVGHSDIPVRSHVICSGGRSNGVFCRRRRLTFALSAFVLCFRRVAHDYLFAMVSYVPITNSRAIQRDSWTAHPTILLQYNKPVILFIKPIRS